MLLIKKQGLLGFASLMLLLPSSVHVHAGSFTGLGHLAGGTFSEPSILPLSADGSAVVGDSTSPDGSRAFRWTTTGGMASLGVLGVTPWGTSGSLSRAVSADGSVVVGTSSTASGQDHAFRWTS